MLICEKVYEKTFTGRSTKEAYLDACKWVATSVIAVNNGNHIVYRITKEESKSSFLEKKVKVTLYAAEEEEEILNQNCGMCKEMNSHFYLKENKYLCETCRILPYRERMKQRLKKIIEGMQGRFI